MSHQTQARLHEQKHIVFCQIIKQTYHFALRICRLSENQRTWWAYRADRARHFWKCLYKINSTNVMNAQQKNIWTEKETKNQPPRLNNVYLCRSRIRMCLGLVRLICISIPAWWWLLIYVYASCRCSKAVRHALQWREWVGARCAWCRNCVHWILNGINEITKPISTQPMAAQACDASQFRLKIVTFSFSERH